MADAIPLNIHVENFPAAMRQVKQPLAIMVALEVLGVVRKGSIEPLNFDPHGWVADMRSLGRHVPLTADEIREAEVDLLHFFVVLPDGRWQPNPEIFWPFGECAGAEE
ncbi:hypothetical protein [Roseomonas xinghualingensis]|uniref:hypothetical protein n=1 Tax=Roseomonas xinghualingensis TaxID=2986475 RepID=UPI0021F16F19|nr:hypothetical protein [Roseomonas sp. SXEYE001]MCV4209361.1 hypothetical protein [Roseomonas sp. SXEYE001]